MGDLGPQTNFAALKMTELGYVPGGTLKIAPANTIPMNSSFAGALKVPSGAVRLHVPTSTVFIYNAPPVVGGVGYWKTWLKK